MMIFNYESKKQLKENIGEPLKYTETSFFGAEFKSDGSIVVPDVLQPYMGGLEVLQ